MQLSELQSLTESFKHDGIAYTLSQLVKTDIAQLEYEWKKNAIDEGKKELAEWGAVSPEDRKTLLALVHEERKRRTLDNADSINEVMNSRFGQRWILYLSLRKPHPEITMEWIDKFIEDISAEFYAEILGKIDDISTKELEEDGANPPPETPG